MAEARNDAHSMAFIQEFKRIKDTDIAIEIETKYLEKTQEERLWWSTKMLNRNQNWSINRSGKSSDLEKVIKINHVMWHHYCLKIPKYQVKT